MLRFLLWRLLGLLALLSGIALVEWFLRGGPGRLLRGSSPEAIHLTSLNPYSTVAGAVQAGWSWAPLAGIRPASAFLELGLLQIAGLAIVRWSGRQRRNYVRMHVATYRTDQADAEAVVRMYEALHARLLRRWWRRLLLGQPTVALEVHHEYTHNPVGGCANRAWMAITCPRGLERMLEAALRTAYPNCRLQPLQEPITMPPAVLRLKKKAEFIKRVKSLERFEYEREPSVNRLLTVMGACGTPGFVQVALTPAPVLFERFARRLFKLREERLSHERRAYAIVRDRSIVEDAELRGGLDVQHRPLFFGDIRVGAGDRRTCERIASELRAESAENRLVERGTTIRHGLLSLYRRRLQRGEGNPIPPWRKGVFATSELAAIWHLPSIDYATVPFARSGLPLAPAPPSILRPREGKGTLRDALGAVSIHPELRKQNTAVPGAVEQGKSSFLIATVAEDLRRERCAVIVLDPKGDAADAAVSLVPERRVCTLLDFSRPTCGFNPLAIDAPADVIADYVVAALKNLFTDADIRASSDRYLRNAIIAVLAYDRGSTLWDAARLLSVGEEGYSYRSSVGSRVRTLPEYSEISAFFTAELAAQLADARSTTTAKLDAPVNKLARLLNSPSIKRVLLNNSLSVDFDRVITGGEVLVVKGALGAMGAGNTSVLMQLLVGMLDAALARQQDLVPAEQRVAVALKIDEAPLVINRGFAETMALKRSAGLETVACWQADAQWTEREVRDQLDALFAHRVYFATASVRDARDAVGLTMAEFADTIRPGVARLSTLGHPDVRLHLPKHHAIASWTTMTGRQAPFIASTIPLRVDRDRLALHAARQLERGGRPLTDLSQPHWERVRRHASAPHGETPPPGASSPPAQAPIEERPVKLPCTPSDSYRELVELDLAHSVRRARRVLSPRELDPDALDLQVLALIASLRHVLSSQAHRRFNNGRAITTTQRRLKRLSDAGWVERFQFHRRDGGGVPMCYVITTAGLELLRDTGAREASTDTHASELEAPAPRTLVAQERRLQQARHDVHAAGWALALVQARAELQPTLRGPDEATLSPPQRSTPAGRGALGPADLRLPGGRVPHDFLRTAALGERLEPERFETVRPDVIVELSAAGGARPTPAVDVIVELDDRLPAGRAAAKLERYDHFLAGWSAHTRRYGSRQEALPLVAFVCRDRARAKACALAADATLRACRAYAGEYPFDWDYPGRERTLFVSERDVHDGLLRAYGVPRLPPPVRITEARGDPRVGEASVEARELLP
ncbi:MAG TPA: replication-relaxation family protein [Solirubrobacteraceae bacterium]|nr:replication-relaxation family protein [Solirubrobacteraceae bacterium]